MLLWRINKKNCLNFTFKINKKKNKNNNYYYCVYVVIWKENKKNCLLLILRSFLCNSTYMLLLNSLFSVSLYSIARMKGNVVIIIYLVYRALTLMASISLRRSLRKVWNLQTIVISGSIGALSWFFFRSALKKAPLQRASPIAYRAFRAKKHPM